MKLARVESLVWWIGGAVLLCIGLGGHGPDVDGAILAGVCFLNARLIRLERAL